MVPLAILTPFSADVNAHHPSSAILVPSGNLISCSLVKEKAHQPVGRVLRLLRLLRGWALLGHLIGHSHGARGERSFWEREMRIRAQAGPVQTEVQPSWFRALKFCSGTGWAGKA